MFEGLTREEIAEEMGCGTATVARHWNFARNWLEEAFAGTPRTVTDERWQLAYAIYEAAAPLAEPERKQYVQALAPDAEIAGKVLAMLDEMETAAESDAFPEPAYSIESCRRSALQQPAEWHRARPFRHHRFCRPRGNGQSLFRPRSRPESRSRAEGDRTKGDALRLRKVHSRGAGRFGPEPPEHRDRA